MTNAIQYWKNRVKSHDAQSIRIQDDSSWTSEDFWRPVASRFKSDPHRTDDPLLNRVLQQVCPDTTVLDVGGGAGRYALPLALKCRHITVVEPSQSMIEGLRKGASEVGISNLSIVQELWDVVEPDPSDLVLCAHVIGGVAEADLFIRKLETYSKSRVLMLQSIESPGSQVSPLWKHVHGEERIDSPALPELMSLLWEIEIYPDLHMFDPIGPQTIESREAALHYLRHVLFVRPNTDKDEHLQRGMQELLVETSGRFGIQGARPRRQGLISWSPSRNP